MRTIVLLLTGLINYVCLKESIIIITFQNNWNILLNTCTRKHRKEVNCFDWVSYLNFYNFLADSSPICFWTFFTNVMFQTSATEKVYVMHKYLTADFVHYAMPSKLPISMESLHILYSCSARQCIGDIYDACHQSRALTRWPHGHMIPPTPPHLTSPHLTTPHQTRVFSLKQYFVKSFYHSNFLNPNLLEMQNWRAHFKAI